jgi:predicted RNA-binding Zn-ribbon protein involved in translation (DUF1610 family)
MKQEKIKCIECEVEFEVITDNNLDPLYCPFCGEEIISTDFDEELDKELEELFEELEL